MSSSNQIMNNNYHTHMYLCRHATGDVPDYVEEAIRQGFKTLGMSDHAPFEELKDRSVRMHPSDLPIYIEKCENAKMKYNNEITLYTGLEIEYFTEHLNMYPTLLAQVDYLALGQHYIFDPASNNNLRSSYALTSDEHLQTYVDTIKEALETKFFKFVCHPDLFLYNVRDFTPRIVELSKRLIQAAIDNHTPLEINANGLRKGFVDTPDGPRYKYPREEFWVLAKAMNARMIISSDAHNPNQLMDETVKATYEFAQRLGIVVEEGLDF